MRAFAFMFGALLLIGGGALVVIADMEREAALQQVRDHTAVLETELSAREEANLSRAETLTELRSRIAGQQGDVADTNGFLE